MKFPESKLKLKKWRGKFYKCHLLKCMYTVSSIRIRSDLHFEEQEERERQRERVCTLCVCVSVCQCVSVCVSVCQYVSVEISYVTSMSLVFRL